MITPDEILIEGLCLLGFDARRQRTVERSTNVRRFGSHFGSTPLVCASIWEELKTSEDPAVLIDTSKVSLSKFLEGLYYLKRYPTEEEMAGNFGSCEKTARKWAWFLARRLQALKKTKVSTFSFKV